VLLLLPLELLLLLCLVAQVRLQQHCCCTQCGCLRPGIGM
jgi:hypothetical protein